MRPRGVAGARGGSEAVAVPGGDADSEPNGRSGRGADPVAPLEVELAALWGDPARRRLVRWPLTVRAGHVDAAG